MPLKEKYRIPERLVEYLLKWRAPPTTEELAAEVAKFIRTEPPQRQQQNRPPRPSTHPVVLKPRQLMTAAQLVHLCKARGSNPAEDIQLVMNVMVETEAGQRQTLKALVDTGAQTNCIRTEALPQHYFTPAKNPITLSTVSGD